MIDIIFYICVGLLFVGSLIMCINILRNPRRKYVYSFHVIAGVLFINGIVGTFLLGMFKIFLLFQKLYEGMS